MASTREIRRRIKSVKSTAQITRAMQLVAAAKMHRAQLAALGGKHYATVMARTLSSLTKNVDPASHRLFTQNTTGKELVIFFSSDRGLAGAYNTNLLRQAENLPKDADYVTVGKKGRDYVIKTHKQLVADFPVIDKPTWLQAKQLAKVALEGFTGGTYQKVTLLYTDFVNTLVQRPVTVALLPITPESFAMMRTSLQSTVGAQDTGTVLEYSFEPDAASLLDFVLYHFIDMSIFQVMLEAQASEQSARMIAMKNATDNAKELVNDLSLAYNQARQDSITNELLEITTAAIALS